MAAVATISNKLLHYTSPGLTLRRYAVKWIFLILAACAGIYIFLIRWQHKVQEVKTNSVNNYFFDSLSFQTEVTGNRIQAEQDKEQACVHPQLDINNPDIMKHYHSVPPVTCDTEPDWLTVENGTVYVSKASKQKYGDIECKLNYVLRHDDFETSFTETVHLKSSENLKLKHDFLTGVCESKDKKHHYENIHAGITYKPEIHKRVNKVTSGLGLDVLMIGFDSLSRMAYMRKLKKTHGYFTNILGGITLNGYNIVGDGTPQALIPILTGKTELELPRTLKRLPDKKYVDVFPMVWKDFQANGYVTGYAEDAPNIGTFTYRMNGFKQQPTDHYMRPFMSVARDKYYSKFKKLCLGSKRRTKVFFDWLRDFYVMYRNKAKFMFGFHSEVSHEDNNDVETGDEDLQKTLQYLYDGGYLNNTLVILMSDHGARFNKVRASLQGKQEERRPYFGFAFPKWFQQKHPNIVKNLKTNANRLSSPFDLHPTFLDILSYDNTNFGNTSSRSISLFKEIPKSRTCEDANIDSHWCACLNWHSVSQSSTNVKTAVKTLIDHLNNLTKPHRTLCSELKVRKIVESLSLLPKQNLLKFKRTNDADGFRADLTDDTDLNEIKFQLLIYTTPGNGLFEATLTHKIKDNIFVLKTEDISRINKYGSDPKCIESSHEELRKYCYCNSNLNHGGSTDNTLKQ